MADPVEAHPPIEILFGGFQHDPDWRNFFDGSGGVLAHTFMPDAPPYWSATDASDMHFDAEEDWTANPGAPGIDFVSVFLHELGHAIGLGHSTNPNAVMFRYYNGRRTLDYDDVAQIHALYGPYADYDTLYIKKLIPESDDNVIRDGSAFWVKGTHGSEPWFVMPQGQSGDTFVTASASGFSYPDSLIVEKKLVGGGDNIVRNTDVVWIRTSLYNRWWYNDKLYLIADHRDSMRSEYMILKVTPQDPALPETLDDVIRDGDLIRVRNLTPAHLASGDEWITCIGPGEGIRGRRPMSP